MKKIKFVLTVLLATTFVLTAFTDEADARIRRRRGRRGTGTSNVLLTNVRPNSGLGGNADVEFDFFTNDINGDPLVDVGDPNDNFGFYPGAIQNFSYLFSSDKGNFPSELEGKPIFEKNGETFFFNSSGDLLVNLDEDELEYTIQVTSKGFTLEYPFSFKVDAVEALGLNISQDLVNSLSGFPVLESNLIADGVLRGSLPCDGTFCKVFDKDFVNQFPDIFQGDLLEDGKDPGALKLGDLIEVTVEEEVSVPEPTATAGLLALGTLGTGILRKRKKS